MRIETREFGKARDGKPVTSYSLYQDNGTFCTLLDHGATLQRLLMPDRDGRFQDVVLGYDSMDGYLSEANPYHGAVIGRCANRIHEARFSLGDKTYELAQNDGRHHLHGGKVGFDKVLWHAEPLMSEEGPSVRFYHHSADGDENYPGNLDVQVTYTLTADQALVIRYDAIADAQTVINLTNHAYFNLAGQGSGSILKHEVMLEADRFTEVDADCIPTGRILPVEGTPLDFRKLKPIGRDIQVDHPMLKNGQGYDHNFVLADQPRELTRCAAVYEPVHGRRMTVETTLPGLQLYSGNMMQPDTGKEGVRYDRRNGLCLETQFFPDAVNQASFAQPIFAAKEPFRHVTVYRFDSQD